MSPVTRKTILAATAGLLCVSTSVQAISIGGFDPIKAVTNVVTAPAATMINVAKVVTGGANAKTILDPYKDAARAVAPLPSVVANVATWPQEQMYQQAQTLAAKAGAPGSFVFDVATFGQRYQQELVKTSGAAAANVLLGQNPLQMVAMPLAAAIREARARHISNAKPLPPDVKRALSNFFDQDVLERARYTVGTVEITLPNGIGKVQKFFGNDYAVVVDDVIVFPKDPGTFQRNPQWWGHEVTHVQQYKNWGVDEFAFRYVKSLSQGVENPAISRGDEVLAWARQNLRDQAGSLMALEITTRHQHDQQQTEPLLPAAYVQLQNEKSGTQADADPPVIRCFFPGDPLEYYGTKQGRIIVVDPQRGQWMHIGWAVPPDVPGPAWVYLIPGRGSYDVFANGQIVQRFTPGPFGPAGPPGPPMQIGHVAKLQ